MDNEKRQSDIPSLQSGSDFETNRTKPDQPD